MCLRREERKEVEGDEIVEGKEKKQVEENEHNRHNRYEQKVAGEKKPAGCRPWQLYVMHMDIATGDSLVILLLSPIAHDTP